jgi:hypothetical protein
MTDLLTFGIYPACAIFSTIILLNIAIQLEKMNDKL